MKLCLLGGLAAVCALLAGPVLGQTYTGPIAQARDVAAIDISTATTTEIVAASSVTTIEITAGMIYAGGTGNLTFKAGTGTNCGTNTRSLSGPIPLKDQGGFPVGVGAGIALATRSGEALCITTSAAVQMSGWLTYARR